MFSFAKHLVYLVMQSIIKTKKLQKVFANPAWALVAAFGTYFCMYGFRKPYTAATYAEISLFGLSYKFLLVIAQTLGYVLAKWIGIKIVSEIKSHQRIKAILGFIGFAEVMLLLFGLVPNPFNVIFLFLNGLSLGVIFGLVLGFVEGRKHTEFMVAGLCASFIISDGVSKSVGAYILASGVTEQWMPFVAGLVFLIPTLLFIAMLTCVPAPSARDIALRSARVPMTAEDRSKFFNKYAPGLIGIILVYLIVTLLRSVRADFAVEIWSGLGYEQTPDLFTRSELLVSFGVIIISGFAAFIHNHYKAFSFSLFTSLTGFMILLFAVAGLNHGADKFISMVLIGLGIYIPYVAVHAIMFERLIAITREKANVGFLMYIADSVGYTGYIGLMILKSFAPASDSIFDLFLKISIGMGIFGILLIIFCYLYFKNKLKSNEQQISTISAGQGYTV